MRVVSLGWSGRWGLPSLGLLILLVAGATGCTQAHDQFTCTNDGQCVSGVVQGVCQPGGFCSFPATDCPSGQRFASPGGGPNAGQCVSVDAAVDMGLLPDQELPDTCPDPSRLDADFPVPYQGECSVDQWCWRSPIDLNAVSSPNSGSVFAVGATGLILQWDGTTWTEPVKATHRALLDVFAINADEAVAVGEGGAMLTWNGFSWSQVTQVSTTANLNAVWASADTDMWVVGDQSIVYKWNGCVWSAIPLPGSLPLLSLRGVWGTLSDDVWVVGIDPTTSPPTGYTLHWDGTAWGTPIPTAPGVPLRRVWGSGTSFATDDLYASTTNGTQIAVNGLYHLPPGGTATWTKVVDPAFATQTVSTGLSSATNDVWAVGFDKSTGQAATVHFNGTSWTRQDLPGYGGLTGITLATSCDLWAVGFGGEIEHYNSTSWVPVEAGTSMSYSATWSAGSTDGWAVGGDGIAPPGVTHVTSAGDVKAVTANNGWSAIYGLSSSDVWAVGGGGRAMHWNGTAWSENDTGDTSTTLLLGVWAAGTNDVWATGFDTATNLAHFDHWNGTTWSVTVSAVVRSRIHDLGGWTTSNIWAVGVQDTGGGSYSTPLFMHYDGTAWTKVTGSGYPATGNLMAVWADPASTSEMWAVGSQTSGALVAYYNGVGWADVTGTRMPTGVPLLTDVWGTGLSDVWMVGDGGTVLHYDGTAWTPEDSGATTAFSGVYASSPTDIWLVAQGGEILHHN
jgi:hypothetical protein